MKEWLFAPLIMNLQGKIEAIIYAAEEPVTLDQLATLLKRDVVAELEALASETAPLEFASDANTTDSTAPEETAGGAESEGLAIESRAASAVHDETTQSDTPPEAPTETSTGSEEPSEVRHHPERAPESTEPLSVPEPIAASASAAVKAATAVAPKRKKPVDPDLARVKGHLKGVMQTVIESYAAEERGVEIRQIAGGYRMATKPEHHDLVRAFAKSLKPPIKLSLQALETLAIIAYKQPVTQPEIADIRGVDSGGVLGTLLERKLITTAGRKQVIGRPMQYKTTKEFLMRFGMNDLNELPSMEEFEKLAQEQTDMFSKDVPAETGPAPADGERDDAPDRDAIVADAAEAPKSGHGELAHAHAESDLSSQPQRPPEEPAEPEDAGDRSDGADTSESIVREQLDSELAKEEKR